MPYVLRFVSFDIATSEICRDIDPKSDGMMLGMVITADSRFTAAFTKYVIFLLDLNNLTVIASDLIDQPFHIISALDS